MNTKNTTRNLVRAALIAAIYAALTYAAAGLGIAYGPIQFRLSEALTILAVFTPAAIPGLTIGCFLGNLGSPYGIIDILCGTAATFIASVATYYIAKKAHKLVPILAPLPPVIANAVIIGLEITLFLP
ncbi:MAG: QueT transporter family protein, partial [Oscillospiraceae bacterium]|nr:QueT transporter family protein [Oscillospiraceae bacterium]